MILTYLLTCGTLNGQGLNPINPVAYNLSQADGGPVGSVNSQLL